MPTEQSSTLSNTQYLKQFTNKAMASRIPLDGSIELTHRCNLRCIHCYLGDQTTIRTHQAEELTTTEVLDAIDQMVAAGTLNLTITGGDPMIRQDFPDIYAYAVKKGLLITVFCDGILVTDRIIDLFNKFPPRNIEISLYGATRQTYELITQVKGAYQHCIEGIQRLKANGHRFKLKTVLMEQNKHELKKMESMAKSYGVDFYLDWAIFPCMPSVDNCGHSNTRPAHQKASIEVTPPSFKDPLDLRVNPIEAAELDISNDEQIEKYAEFYIRTKDMQASDYLYQCGAGLTTFHIDPYGNMQPCTVYTKAQYNLRQGSFLDGWNGPIAKIRKIKIDDDNPCTACHLRNLCRGCPPIFALENGNGNTKSEYICQTTQAVYERIENKVTSLLRNQHYENKDR
ncbi:Radical SAM domain heme biosynthesis protein [hydrothermal vent metagenome]|uniref:Radical SAM domain heme biosynthesis protein n=1 Tax=hydrothermal vent metagenome TaxID=652676 RepID=A0A3B1BLM4_9ZZZZ